jgi:ASC-1-like (ASCH) protein
VDETIALQQQGWRLDAAMPAAYHPDTVTQQWSFDIGGENVMRMMRVKQRFLDFIKSGQKTLEVRVGYDSVKTVKPGERVSFSSRDQTQVVRVNGVRNYQSFEAMLEHEKAERIVPGMDLGNLLRLLREIYPPDRERLGVVVLEIEPETRAEPANLVGGHVAQG